MVGMNKVPEKERRKIRRTNHVAKDLRTNKYSQKVVPAKKKDKYDKYFEEDEDDEYY
jgi:hypothetical protein